MAVTIEFSAALPPPAWPSKARTSAGMRVATGAISEARVQEGRLRCHVQENAAPRGICGSGLVDAIAPGLDLGLVLPAGRLAANQEWMLEPPVSLTQFPDGKDAELAKVDSKKEA